MESERPLEADQKLGCRGESHADLDEIMKGRGLGGVGGMAARSAPSTLALEMRRGQHSGSSPKGVKEQPGERRGQREAEFLELKEEGVSWSTE